MLTYLIRRLFAVAVMLVVIILAVFCIFFLIPKWAGIDPATMFVGKQADKASIEGVREKLQLDEPVRVERFAGRRVVPPHVAVGVPLVRRESRGGQLVSQAQPLQPRGQPPGEVVAAPHDGGRWHVDAGGPGLGTSGSGDVLAGAIAGLLARGADAAQAAVWATHLHAAAGDRLSERIAPVGYLARELCAELPHVLAAIG